MFKSTLSKTKLIDRQVLLEPKTDETPPVEGEEKK